MEDPNRSYRTLYFLVKHGRTLANAVPAATVLLGIVLWLAGMSPWAVPIAAASAAFLYLVLHSYVELVRVIVDMLLPK